MARAHKCPLAGIHCPHNADPARGAWCPAWTTYAQTNISSGEERVVEECMFHALPKFMLEGVKASNRAATTAESQRNHIAAGFEQLVGAMHSVRALSESEHEALRLEEDDGK